MLFQLKIYVPEPGITGIQIIFFSSEPYSPESKRSRLKCNPFSIIHEHDFFKILKTYTQKIDMHLSGYDNPSQNLKNRHVICQIIVGQILAMNILIILICHETNELPLNPKQIFPFLLI